MGSTEEERLLDFIIKNMDGPSMDLENKNIAHFPTPTLAYYTSVVVLNLSRNFVEELPWQFCEQFLNVKILNLSKNFLKELPSNFGSLSSLSYLDLSDNELVHLPLDMFRLKKLWWLNVARNILEQHLSTICGPCRNDIECHKCAHALVAFMLFVFKNVAHPNESERKLAETRSNQIRNEFKRLHIDLPGLDVQSVKVTNRAKFWRRTGRQGFFSEMLQRLVCHGEKEQNLLRKKMTKFLGHRIVRCSWFGLIGLLGTAVIMALAVDCRVAKQYIEQCFPGIPTWLLDNAGLVLMNIQARILAVTTPMTNVFPFIKFVEPAREMGFFETITTTVLDFINWVIRPALTTSTCGCGL